jgi:hypothetical protein
MPGRLWDRRKIRRIGQFVDIDDERAGVCQQMSNDSGADKAGATRYENS